MLPGMIGRRGLIASLAACAAIAATTGSASAAGEPFRFECAHGSAGVERTSTTCGATIVDGRAVAPSSAPAPVREAIEAANRLRGRPYVWGGGHLGWAAQGYDCSGAVGYALHAAGLLERTMVSGELERWGEGGVGRWVTVYANWHHVYMVIAGLRFDTRDDLPGVTGPRWHRDMPDPKQFTARHPTGL